MKARVDSDCNHDSSIITTSHQTNNNQKNLYYVDNNLDAQRQRHTQRHQHNKRYDHPKHGQQLGRQDRHGRPARPTATAKAHTAPAKIPIMRSGHVNHADHLGTDIMITTADHRRQITLAAGAASAWISLGRKRASAHPSISGAMGDRRSRASQRH